MKRWRFCFLLILALFGSEIKAQSIDISRFYYRDYLDFGQNKGAFNGENSNFFGLNSGLNGINLNTNSNLGVNSNVNSNINLNTNANSNGTTLTGKDGKALQIPNVPDFSPSSNYGSLSSVGRGFVVTANHVESPQDKSQTQLRKWGLSSYDIAQHPIDYGNGITSKGESISDPYGRDEKFLRLDKYIVEGSVDMLDFENSIASANAEQESTNIEAFKKLLENFKDDSGDIYLYQAGSGIVTLRGTNNEQSFNTTSDGQLKGGGFGTLGQNSISYENLVSAYRYCDSEGQNCEVRGIMFSYFPDLNFNNRITSGDSGSGIYAYDNANKKWVLVGVTSQEYPGQNRAYIAAVSNKDLQDYQSKFEQKIDLKVQDPAYANTWTLSGNGLKYQPRGDTPNASHTLETNKDIVFSGGGVIEVASDIYRNTNGYAGGFVFEVASGASATNPTTYKFTNSATSSSAHIFKGSGLDIGENVEVEWALRNASNDSLHKIGLGTLIVKTAYTGNENLGYLKVGQGKVIFDTDKKAYEGVYITSGRGEIALVQGKAESLGAVKNTTTSLINSINSNTNATNSSVNSANSLNLNLNSANSNENSYTLAQDNADNMGFYFGTGGGRLDLGGNSLILNTIAANDSKAFITNSSTLATLEIQGFGYDSSNNKTSTKANTIIHASLANGADFNANSGTNSTNSANLNLVYKDSKTHNASLIFDGHIDIKGALNAENSSIVLQGHPTTHASISDTSIASKVQNAESGTSAAMPSYMDLSRPSTLQQPDWDSRYFGILGGIDLKNSSLNIGKAAVVNANITADGTSSIIFGGTHFIDSKDGKNVGGSGFYYNQNVESGELTNESYKDSLYVGTITANGAKIASNFANFAPSLELSNSANLTAKNLTLNSTNTLNFQSGSSAKIENLVFSGVSDLNKITLDNTSAFNVEKSLIFDKSTFNLDTFSSANSALTLPTSYDLYALNGSNITAKDFTNSKENAEFVVQNSSFNAETMNFTNKASFILADNANLTLIKDLTAQNLDLSLENSNFTGNIFTSKDLKLNLLNSSRFTAQTLTASGFVSLNSDENSSITLTTLNLNAVTQTNISQNVSIETLNLSQSSVNFEHLSTQIPKSIDLKANSNLYLNELNLNANALNITSDTNSHTHIKRLIYDISKTQNTTQIPQSNLIISERFELKNVGQNLGTTQGADDEKLKKDLLALEFNKDLEFKSGAKLDINFADKVSKDSKDLILGKSYTIFTAQSLINGGVDINLNLNASSTDFFVRGSLGENAFFVEFVRENPRSFAELNPHINPAYSSLLEVLLRHDKNDASIDKAVNLSDYKALNSRLAALDESFKRLANTSGDVLQALPLLHRQEINARIRQNRLEKFALDELFGAKFALNDRLANPTQRSDIVPRLAFWSEKERANRVWSSASAGYFTQDSGKLSLQSISIGYDKRLLDSKLLLGVLGSLTNASFSDEALSQSPKIYTLALYSDVLFGSGELQNELSVSFASGEKSFEGESGDYKGFGAFFDSIYKARLGFLPQSIKPLALVRVSLDSQNAFETRTYKHKAYENISVGLGLGLEWLYERESGFYAASLLVRKDFFQSNDSVEVSLANAQKFITYKLNEHSFIYELHLFGLENFTNGLFVRYGVGAYLASSAYKGVKADLQLGYRF